MSEYSKLLVTTLLGIISGLVLAAISNKYLVKTEKRKLSELFINEKYEIYKSIWKEVERIHILLREKEVSDADIKSATFNLNKKIIENSLHLDQKDAQLISDYIEAVKELKANIYRSKTYGLAGSWEISSEVSSEDQIIMTMVDNVNVKKNIVIDKIRKVIAS
jgi:hypothetical protein